MSKQNQSSAPYNEDGNIARLLNIATRIASAKNRDALATCLRQDFFQLFCGDFITLWVHDERFGRPANFLGSPVIKGMIPAAALTGEPPMPDAFCHEILSKKEAVRIRLTAIEKIAGPNPYSNFWRRKKITQLLTGPLTLDNKTTGIICIYYSTETQLLAQHSDLLTGYLQLLATAVGNVLSREKNDRTSSMLEPSEPPVAEIVGKGETVPDGSRLIGNSKIMQGVNHLIRQVASADTTVLLTGETGTGKELVAQAIHSGSHRSQRIMIRINCAAMPATLIESELFGHEKGSFTGAHTRRIGKFEQAQGSTILLDEVGEMPLETQAKLLRVLQEKEIERIGGNNRIKVDVRIIAATNRDLRKEVDAGKFRGDLYYRLNVFPIYLPPLRQRKDDIPELTQYFLHIYAKKNGKKIPTIPAKAMQRLKDYSFPGNIRELEHIVHRTVLGTERKTIREFDLPETPEASTNPELEIQPLRNIEKEYILKAIKASSGRISGPLGAAAKLGLPATTLLSRMERLGIKKKHR